MGFVAVTQLQPGRRTSVLNCHMHVTRDADPIWLGESCVCVGYVHVCCISVEREARSQKSSWRRAVPLSPPRDAGAHLLTYVPPFPTPGHEETVTEASGMRRPLAELNRPCLKAQRQETSLRSQKATLIASDGCIPLPSDGMALFCLDCSCICIYSRVCVACVCVCVCQSQHITVYLAHFVSKIKMLTFSTQLLSGVRSLKRGPIPNKTISLRGNRLWLTLQTCHRHAGPGPASEQPSVGAEERGYCVGSNWPR